MWEWIDGRWHFDGKPIHAGDGMEIRWPDKTWEPVRIESADAGRILKAYFDHHGETLQVRVRDMDETYRDVRW